MACRNNCIGACVCPNPCAGLNLEGEMRRIYRYNNLGSLKILKGCESEMKLLKTGDLFYITETGKYYAFNANSNGWRETNITIASSDVVLP